MTQEAGTPRDFWDRVQEAAEKAVNKYIRGGLLNSASISSGGLTIKGGFLMLLNASGLREAFYVGPVIPTLPDGSPQPGMLLRREDGTLAMALYDPAPGPTVDDFKQFLAIYDRSQGIVVSDDTDSGQGLARPYVPIPVTRARYTDMVAVTDGSFVDVFDSGPFYKVNARALATIRCTTDVSGTTGEVRVLVDAVQVGTTVSVGFAVATNFVGPFVVPNGAYTSHQIKIQARRTAGTGAVRLDASVWGMQS